MTARDRNTRLGADRGATLQNRTHRFDRQFIERHAEYGQRHNGLSTHGVNVGDGIGSSNPAEITRIIHHWHEEVGRGDNAVLIIDLPDGGIVAGFSANEKLYKGSGCWLTGKKLLQNRRCELASAAAAMREIGQA